HLSEPASAEASLAVVAHVRVPGRHGPLPGRELDLDPAVEHAAQRPGRIELPIPRLRGVLRALARRRAGDPGRFVRGERALHQQRMIMTLHHDEAVRSEIFSRDVPGLACPADADALALPDGVEGKADVLAD